MRDGVKSTMNVTPVAIVVEAPPADWRWEQRPFFGPVWEANPDRMSKRTAWELRCGGAWEYSPEESKRVWKGSETMMEANEIHFNEV